MIREQILREIGTLLDGKCDGCETHKRIEQSLPKGHYARVDQHCLKACPVGQKLQELGQQLNQSRAPATYSGPRQARREWMLAEDPEPVGVSD